MLILKLLSAPSLITQTGNSMSTFRRQIIWSLNPSYRGVVLLPGPRELHQHTDTTYHTLHRQELILRIPKALTVLSLLSSFESHEIFKTFHQSKQAESHFLHSNARVIFLQNHLTPEVWDLECKYLKRHDKKKWLVNMHHHRCLIKLLCTWEYQHCPGILWWIGGTKAEITTK